MLIHYEIKKNVVTIKMGQEIIEGILCGEIELDNENSHILDNLFNELVPKGYLNYLLDLQNISYIYSYGVSIVINTYKFLNERDGKIKILNPSSFVRNLLDTLKMFNVFEVFVDEKQAIKSFNKKSFF
ncbi:MAG: hypothetical protein A2Y40_05185 [Candidatus Margulisbacteria bacterium GWF2_35_9]|nr:MAG: hypothetical protein A2Y40_05185 [Candidatus Margulisbacteria bacterium GWF2_35_9]